MEQGATTVVFFSTLFQAFDANVMQTINTGSAAVISLITPLVAVCFTTYLILVTLSYWRGNNEDFVIDFWMRMLGALVWIAFGLNIQYYSTYVVPFFNGFGDDLASALAGTPQTGSALDALCTAYVTAMWHIFQAADGIEDTLNAIAFILLTMIFAVPFIAVAAAYIILAKFALGILLALGPIFFGAGIFPWTRQFFMNWVGQCLNYGFLVCLFAAAGMLEINFAKTMVPSSMTLTALFQLVMMGISFLIISLNLPGLASQLAGGVGISSMVGKLAGAASGAAAVMKALSKMGGNGGGAGGSMSGGNSGGGAGKMDV